MARITVEDCIDKFESRFELVLVASNRARKLHAGETPTVEKDNDKNTVIALREIAGETVAIDSLKEKLIEEYQTVSIIDDENASLDYSDTEEYASNDSDLSKNPENIEIFEPEDEIKKIAEDQIEKSQNLDIENHGEKF